MDDFRQRHGEGAALNRHLSIGVLRSRIHHGKLKAQELLKAEKDSGTKHSEKELDDIIEKEMASISEPFFLGKKTKGSKEKQGKRPLENPKETGPAQKSASKSPSRVAGVSGTPQIEEMVVDQT